MAKKRSKRCSHTGEPVRVGPYQVLAGGTMYWKGDMVLLPKAELIIPLTTHGFTFPSGQEVYDLVLKDFGGVPKDWERRLRQDVIPELESGVTILTFCAGSHGRTGCFLGSLIAILESPHETPDPIAAVRERHCLHAVETFDQAEAIFALRGQEVPEFYHDMCL